jgi:hypothetical protein
MWRTADTGLPSTERIEHRVRLRAADHPRAEWRGQPTLSPPRSSRRRAGGVLIWVCARPVTNLSREATQPAETIND